MEETSRRVGDYEILSVLGAGGMGKVFKVRNVISDRIEAMKILLPDLAGRQDLADRFLREIKLLAGLNHPNIAALCTALTLQNQLVMVMEYVEGTTLAARLERGPIPPAEAINYIDQILGALSYAHQRGVIHRDIKPANMMLTPQGVVKLMDFGIARSAGDHGLTMTGTTLGSLYYMSPEQVKGQATDGRSDLYALGVSFYEMLTGQRPFRATSDYALMSAQLEQPPKPPIELQPGLPSALNEIILLAMDKDPAKRFQNADAFRNALKSVRNLPAPASALSPPAPVPGAAAALFQGRPASTAGMATTATLGAQSGAPIPQPPAVPSMPAMSPKPGGHRGLYMALGAVIALAVLATAGIYVPRWVQTQASEQAQAKKEKQKKPDTPAPTTDSTQTQGGGNAGQQPPDTTGQQPPDTNGKDAQNQTTGGNGGSAPVGSVEGGAPTPTPAEPAPEAKKETPQVKGTGPGPQPPKPPAEDPHLLEEAERQVDNVTSRAAAVNGSLDTLRQQQSAQGLGLRGDIASTQESMKIHLSRAQAALDNHDAKKAKKYSDQAEAELEKLEKFLGR